MIEALPLRPHGALRHMFKSIIVVCANASAHCVLRNRTDFFRTCSINRQTAYAGGLSGILS
jgi:hypothetical protein